MDRLRKLQNHEAKFLRNPVAHVSIICRLTGKVDEKKVDAAVQRMLIKHPLTDCRIEVQADGFWLVRHHGKKLYVRVEERIDDTTWHRIFAEEHKTAFNITEGPLIKFCLIKGEHISEFIGICQHSICDGTGLAYLMADVLLLLENPGLEVTELPLPLALTPENIKNMYKQNPFTGNIKRFIMHMMNKKWEKNNVSFDQTDLDTIYRTLWGKYSYKIVSLEWEKPKLQKLVDRCHREKVSINSALTVAFIGAYEKICGSFDRKKRSVAVPVNLRERINHHKENVLDLYVGSAMFKYEYDHNTSVWENAGIFNNKMKKNVNNRNLFKGFYETNGLNPFLLDGMAFALTGKNVDPGEPRYEKLKNFSEDKNNMAALFVKKFLEFIPGTIMTNLARLKIKENYGDFRLERMYFAPSSSPYLKLAIGAVTVSDCLVVTLNYAEPDGEDTLTDKMKKVVEIAETLLVA